MWLVYYIKLAKAQGQDNVITQNHGSACDLSENIPICAHSLSVYLKINIKLPVY